MNPRPELEHQFKHYIEGMEWESGDRAMLSATHLALAAEPCIAKAVNEAKEDLLQRLREKQGSAKGYSPEMLVVGVGYIIQEQEAIRKELEGK